MEKVVNIQDFEKKICETEVGYYLKYVNKLSLFIFTENYEFDDFEKKSCEIRGRC